MDPHPTFIDLTARQRLAARFGSDVHGWFDELPDVLAQLAKQWRLQLGAQIPRGTVSAVFRCQMGEGRAAVLKLSPDRARIAHEAEALMAWHTVHVPRVIGFDEALGALLIDEIEPGTPLGVSSDYPAVELMAELVSSLHTTGARDGSFPSVEQRVGDLFRSSMKLYERNPAAVDVVPTERYDRGQALAERLARSDAPVVLLHGDLTPNNILNGGEERGLVAIDPAPCIGDAAFDAADLVMWRADDLGTIEARAERFAAAIGIDASVLFSWCVAFAGMNALELASQGDGHHAQVDVLAELASKVDAT